VSGHDGRIGRDITIDSWQIAMISFSVLGFVPSPPPIVSATRFRDVLQGFGGAVH
jgi:hypothetical protein